MDSRRVTDESDWDALRLQETHLTDPVTAYSSKDAHRVILKVSPLILQCKCVRQLLPHLVRRNVLSDEVSAHILGQSESEAANSLDRVLVGVAHQPDGQRVIGSVYLALFDCYEESGSAWCRSVAASSLRTAVLTELKQPDPDPNYYDLAVVHRGLSSVSLSPQDASQLKQMLHLTGSSTDLKEIVYKSIGAQVEFSALVLSLLLIPSLGRHASQLLPYCYCNPSYVHEMLHRLKQHWKKLAAHLGFTEEEIDDVVRAGAGDVCREIQMFMRIWWMPDCGQGATQSILSQVMKEKLQISESVMDGGQSLLRACMESNWVKAETYIKAGSPLECRSEDDGRTPLMHACVRGREDIVQLLIDYGADLQAMDKRGETCLNFQQTLRNRVILEVILKEYKKRDFSVDVESLSTQCSPLSTACKCGAAASAELLLEYGANPDGCENGRHRPLVEACAQGHTGLVRALLKKKAGINAVGSNGVTPLLQACTSNQWYMATLLMDEGADVNKCGSDCSSPLFLAVSANAYPTALALIKKGANVDAIRLQQGAVEGIVELTPLASAAGKGLNEMIKLLIENGARVNYHCSDTLPAIAFSIIGDHIETFHLLFDTPNLDRSLTGLSPTIITSVRTEKYYYTEKLLEPFGGPQVAIMEAQQHHLDQLVEHILMYMQAVQHPHLSEESLMSPQFAAQSVAHPQVDLNPEDHRKVNQVLTRFSRICVSAVMEGRDSAISNDDLVGIAQVAGSSNVASFFRKMIASAMSPEDVRYHFLQGDPSPLRFVIDNKILTMDIFQIEVLKFHPDDADVFYKDLVWTFRHMAGGTDLPTDIHSMLSRLFNGRFRPMAPPRSPGMRTEDSYYGGARDDARPQSIPQALETPETAHVEVQTKMDRNLKENSIDSARSLSGGAKGNPLPGDMSKTAKVAAEHVKYNIPNQEPINCHDDCDEIIHTTDRARVVRPMPLRIRGINRKLGGLSSYYEIIEDEADFRLPNCVVVPTDEILGHGSYGDVIEVTHKGKLYAAKKYRLAASGALAREQDILSSIRHRNIVPYYGVCKLPDGTQVIVMEKLKINLSSYLATEEIIDLIKKFHILSDVANGLQHLHLQRPAIIHRDLTAGNVLLNRHGVAKISDFGNSKMVDLLATPEILTSNPGALDYMPPEALEGCQYTNMLDMFSYGHLAIHIIIQQRPHPLLRHTYREHSKLIPRTEVERRQVYLEEVKRRLEGGEQHPFYPIIIKCLNDDANHRPSCADILRCSVFADFRNNAI